MKKENPIWSLILTVKFRALYCFPNSLFLLHITMRQIYKNITVIFIFNFMIVNNVKEKKSVPQIDTSPIPTALKKIVSRIFSEILSQCAVLSAFWCWQMLFPWGHPVTFEQEQQQPRVRANGLNLNNIGTYVWGCMMCTTSLY